jgi:hypothetical protein
MRTQGAGGQHGAMLAHTVRLLPENPENTAQLA